MSVESSVTPLKLKEKVGYAMGDVASNFYWRVFDMFLLIFYTDVFGLHPGAVGTMILVTRIIDAVSDPVMGAVADRTNSRFGKFRPYLLWGIIPIAAAGVLTFTVPDMAEGGKLVWAYATYVFMMLAYTFINVPYGALLGVVTSSSQDRTALASFRFIGAFSGGTLVAYTTPILVDFFGGADKALGWQLTMGLYGAVAAFLFASTFFATKERVVPIQKEATPVLQDIKDLTKNGPWLTLFALALIIMVTISLRSSTSAFYIKYYVGRPDLMGSFLTTYMLALMAGAAINPILVKWFDKKALLLALMAMVAALSAGAYLVPKDNITLIFIFQAAIGLCLGPKSPLVFSMYADTADYSEWKNGRRATAMIFSAAAFSQKLGGALAGATIGWVLAYFGYVANAVQSNASESGILLLMTIVPGAVALISVFCIRQYSLSEQQVADINKDLANRKAVKAAA